MKNIVIKSILLLLSLILVSCAPHKSAENKVSESFVMVDDKHGKDIVAKENEKIQRQLRLLEGKIITKEKYLEIRQYYEPLIEGYKLDDEWYLYEVVFEKSSKFYQSYGNLFLKYKREDIYFCSAKNVCFPITEVLYLYKKNDEYKLLGKKNILGIYNNKGKLILKCPETGNPIAGYTSQDLFEYPFSNDLCLKKDDCTIYSCDTFGSIIIDYTNNTITAKSMDEILKEACRED